NTLTPTTAQTITHPYTTPPGVEQISPAVPTDIHINDATNFFQLQPAATASEAAAMEFDVEAFLSSITSNNLPGSFMGGSDPMVIGSPGAGPSSISMTSVSPSLIFAAQGPVGSLSPQNVLAPVSMMDGINFGALGNMGNMQSLPAFPAQSQPMSIVKPPTWPVSNASVGKAEQPQQACLPATPSSTFNQFLPTTKGAGSSATTPSTTFATPTTSRPVTPVNGPRNPVTPPLAPNDPSRTNTTFSSSSSSSSSSSRRTASEPLPIQRLQIETPPLSPSIISDNDPSRIPSKPPTLDRRPQQSNRTNIPPPLQLQLNHLNASEIRRQTSSPSPRPPSVPPSNQTHQQQHLQQQVKPERLPLKLLEQRRREQLRDEFQKLRAILPMTNTPSLSPSPLSPNDDEGNGNEDTLPPMASSPSGKAPNRIEILQRTVQYISDLKDRHAHLIEKIAELRRELG
ncbi:hypothetical protein HK102_008944, partial [Quaeritorhiza haematococci]